MRKVVLGALYLVVAIALLYAAGMTYALIELWEIKSEIGTVPRTILHIVGSIVIGAGLPYCMIHYLKKNQ